MQKRLIIAEKPSVARDIARVLGVTQRGDGCLYDAHTTITWCFGHLVSLASPAHYRESWDSWSLADLPLLPDTTRYQAIESGQEQLERLVTWLTDTSFDHVINACDAGREGEVIFGYVYHFAQSSLPVKRLWISSLTDEAISDGLQNLQPGQDFDPLYQAGCARGEADWLVGLNATRLVTLLARQQQPLAKVPVLSVGRVQTPTLALVVARDRARQRFQPVTTWGLEATFCTLQGGQYKGKACKAEGEALMYVSEKDARTRVDSFDLRAEAQVVVLDTTETKRGAPQFFDLTSLQREANTRLGFSAQHTLDMAQSLYETHKLLTYPRTDSRYITPDLAKTLIPRIKTLQQDRTLGELALTLVVNASSLGKRLVNAAKVSDHHAILPTTEKADHKNLSPDERLLYELVCRRTMAALSTDARLERTRVVTRWGNLLFETSGTRTLDPGWMAFERPEQEDKEGESDIPSDLALQLKVAGTKLDAYSSTTRAPAALTESSLLRAMETAGKSLEQEDLKEAITSTGGLGTPATRASTIETLLKRGYIERHKKSLNATPLGHSLISALDDSPVGLTRAEMTAKWELALSRIEDGSLEYSVFMEKTRLMVQGMVTHLKQHPSTVTLPERESVGACPACQKKLFLSDRGAWCEGLRTKECTFYVSRVVAGKTLTKTQLKQLLGKKKTSTIKGFTSQKGTSFDAALVLEEDAERGWRVNFSFPDPVRQEIGVCPSCQKKLFLSEKGVWCEDRSCQFFLFGTVAGKKLTSKQLTDLVTSRKTGVIKGLTSKKGSTFEAILVLEEDAERGWRVNFSFPERKTSRGSRKKSSSQEVSP